MRFKWFVLGLTVLAIGGLLALPAYGQDPREVVAAVNSTVATEQRSTIAHLAESVEKLTTALLGFTAALAALVALVASTYAKLRAARRGEAAAEATTAGVVKSVDAVLGRQSPLGEKSPDTAKFLRSELMREQGGEGSLLQGEVAKALGVVRGNTPPPAPGPLGGGP